MENRYSISDDCFRLFFRIDYIGKPLYMYIYTYISIYNAFLPLQFEYLFKDLIECQFRFLENNNLNQFKYIYT